MYEGTPEFNSMFLTVLDAGDRDADGCRIESDMLLNIGLRLLQETLPRDIAEGVFREAQSAAVQFRRELGSLIKTEEPGEL